MADEIPQSVMLEQLQTWVKKECVLTTNVLLDFYAQYTQMIKSIGSSKRRATGAKSWAEFLNNLTKQYLETNSITPVLAKKIQSINDDFIRVLQEKENAPAPGMIEAADILLSDMIAQEIITCQCGYQCKPGEAYPESEKEE